MNDFIFYYVGFGALFIIGTIGYGYYIHKLKAVVDWVR